MKTEKVISAVRIARAEHRKTPLGQLEDLLKQRAKWSRRVTIAQNKLDTVNHVIAEFARDAVKGRQ